MNDDTSTPQTVTPRPATDRPAGCPPEQASPYRNFHGQLMLNPSVQPGDERRLTRLSREMLKLFREAYRKGQHVSTSQLVEVSAQYQSRIWELRRWLVPMGWCIDLTKRGKSGENWYAVVRLDKSTFYKAHRAKLEEEAIV